MEGFSRDLAQDRDNGELKLHDLMMVMVMMVMVTVTVTVLAILPMVAMATEVMVIMVVLCFYCPGTMTSQAESQEFRSTAWSGLKFTTHTTEHRTEPVSTTWTT